MAAPVDGTGDAPVYRFRRTVDVRFRDLDAMGHAHHTLPLIYLEETRAEYWRRVAGRAALRDIDYVMAEVTVRFHERIEWPARLDVGLRTSRLGEKSFDMEFEIRAEDGRLLSSGRTVQVFFDYDAGVSRPLPAELRARIERFEAGAGS
ncbi:MAG: thioesterase family protein [Gemmatimonadota bacterium]